MINKFLNFISGLKEKQVLLLLIGIAFILRLYAVVMSKGISFDGAGYGFMAKDFLKGDFLKGLSSSLHPFYPLMISWVSFDPAHVEIAGRIISLFFGTITLIPVYFLSKEMVDQRGAILSGLFYSFHPYLATYSGMLLSEATYMGLLTLSIYFFWKGLNLKRASSFLLSGAFLGLAYLTRPEGIGYVIVFLIWIIFYRGFKKGGLRKLVFFGALFLPLTLFSAPYIFHIQQETGQWLISKKGLSIQLGLFDLKEEKEIKGVEVPTIDEKIADHSQNLKMVEQRILFLLYTTYHYLRAYHFSLWLFLFFGLIGASQRGSKAEWLLASLILFHLVSLGIFTKSTIRFSIPVIPISLFWAGRGVLEIERLFRKINPSKALVWVSTFMIIVLLIQLPQALKPERRHRKGEKEVGLWLKANTPRDSKIMSNSPIEAFYAEREFVLLPLGIKMGENPGKSIEEIINFAKQRGVRYIVTNENTYETNPDFIKLTEFSEIKELFRYQVGGKKVAVIYEVVR